jgi:hypothetical protein
MIVRASPLLRKLVFFLCPSMILGLIGGPGAPLVRGESPHPGPDAEMNKLDAFGTVSPIRSPVRAWARGARSLKGLGGWGPPGRVCLLEEQSQPDAASKPDVGDHRRGIGLQRLHGGTHEAPVAPIEHHTDYPPAHTTWVTELFSDTCHDGAPDGHLTTVGHGC